MHKLKLMVAALLLVMSTSILSPVPAHAVSLDSPTVETGGILGVLLNLLNSTIFSRLDLSDNKQVSTLPPVLPTTPTPPVTPSVKTNSKKKLSVSMPNGTVMTNPATMIWSNIMMPLTRSPHFGQD